MGRSEEEEEEEEDEKGRGCLGCKLAQLVSALGLQFLALQHFQLSKA